MHIGQRLIFCFTLIIFLMFLGTLVGALEIASMRRQAELVRQEGAQSVILSQVYRQVLEMVGGDALSRDMKRLIRDYQEQVDREQAQNLMNIREAEWRSHLSVAVTGFLSLLLAVILAFRITRGITGPLKELDRGAEALARGNFRHRVPLTGRDELTDLARVFNRTAGTLEGLYRELTAREARFRALIENSSEVVVILDRQGGITYISPSWERLFGRPVEGVPGRAFTELAAPEDREGLAGNLERLWAAGDAAAFWEFTLSPEYRPGRHMEALVHNLLLTPEVGGVVMNLRDVTERKEAEEALRRTEADYRRILDVSPDPVVVYDPAGTAVYLNRAFTAAFGWTLEEFTRPGVSHVPPELWDQAPEKPETIRKGRTVSGLETRRFNKEGKLLEVTINSAVRPGPGGGAGGGVLIIRDVTEHKKITAQLEQARKMEAIGTMAGGIAHDFNNVLQAISGNIQLMLLDPATHEASRGPLTDIDQITRRAAEMINQLLTVSRKTISRMETFNPNQEISRLCRLLERVIPRMVGLSLRQDPGLHPVFGDRSQFEQIILNLVNNAVDAMPEGGELVLETENIGLDQHFCRSHPELSPGPHVLIKVTDNGQGMDARTLEHIFDPFYTTKPPGKGTGLGLSTVYGIVQNHQGMIYCYSNPGQGTVFKIFLPSRADRETPAAEEPGRGGTLEGRETILIVDDEPSILRLGQEILAMYGYRVLTASRGEEAVEIYGRKENGIDLVLMDLNMPGMGGVHCLEALREMDPAAKVVISSGYATDNLARDLRAAGAAGFVSKPYVLTDMVMKVREVLDKGARPA